MVTVIQAIDRAAKVLSSLQGARHLGISELAAALELPPSTVHGIVKSLVTHGLVAKEPNGNRYMLGPALLKLSNVYLDTLDVRARAMRWTQELAQANRARDQARGRAVRRGHRHPPQHAARRQRADAGDRSLDPAHASAMGKVLLAYNPEQADELLRNPLRSLTGDTITDPAKLTTSSRRSSSAVSATEEDEAVIGESSIAAPVVDANGIVIAAVAVVFPSTEWPPEDNVLNDLRETARNISRELGASTWPPTKSAAG